MNKIEVNAIKLIKLLRKAGYEAYFAGGYTRDKILGRRINDIDIATSAALSEIRKILAKNKIRILEIGEKFGVLGALIDKNVFEIATFREEFGTEDSRHPRKVKFGVTAREDTSRRDFTINGMFYDPIQRKTFDFVDGQRDIKKKLIQFIGTSDDRIKEDALRMLRAVRFAAQLDFVLADEAESAIMKNRNLILKISNERIRDEIEKILVSANPARGVLMLYRLGLLELIFPEIMALKEIPQPKFYHAEGNALDHIIEMMHDLPRESGTDFRWAALLHDIGKAPTLQTPEKDGTDRIRFSNHDVVGAEMAENVLRRLAFSNERIEKITWLISHHMVFHNFLFMRVARQRRLMQNPYFRELLLLYRTDAISSIPSTPEGKIRRPDLRVYNIVEKIYEEELARPSEPERLLNGKEIMKLLRISPGPKVGKVLEELRDLQLEGKLKNKKQAIDYLKKYK